MNPHRLKLAIEEGRAWVRLVECPDVEAGMDRPCRLMTENREGRPAPPLGEEPAFVHWCQTHDVETGPQHRPNLGPGDTCKLILHPSIPREWVDYWEADEEYETWVPDPGKDGRGACWVEHFLTEVGIGETSGEFEVEALVHVENESYLRLGPSVTVHDKVDEALRALHLVPEAFGRVGVERDDRIPKGVAVIMSPAGPEAYVVNGRVLTASAIKRIVDGSRESLQ